LIFHGVIRKCKVAGTFLRHSILAIVFFILISNLQIRDFQNPDTVSENYAAVEHHADTLSTSWITASFEVFDRRLFSTILRFVAGKQRKVWK